MGPLGPLGQTRPLGPVGLRSVRTNVSVGANVFVWFDGSLGSNGSPESNLMGSMNLNLGQCVC